MNLYIFPEAAAFTSGYSIAVEQGYRRLAPQKEDLVVWYTNKKKEDIVHYREGDVVIPRINFYTMDSVLNTLKGHIRSELPTSKLSFLKRYSFEHIHCDDVIFYRALRELFPQKHINVRLHNAFSRILFRSNLINAKLDTLFKITLKAELAVEKLIFNDRNATKIFLSNEDRDFYTSMYGIYSDSEVWPFVPDMEKVTASRKEPEIDNHLVWFGGLNSHKKSSLVWFIDNVLPSVRESIPEVELHLYGGKTDSFDNPEQKIFGHGFYDGKAEMPDYNALYINPDIIGGGVKIKLMTYWEAGVPFISTYYGYEGYDKALIDGKFCIVEEKEKWADCIVNYLKKYNKV